MRKTCWFLSLPVEKANPTRTPLPSLSFTSAFLRAILAKAIFAFASFAFFGSRVGIVVPPCARWSTLPWPPLSSCKPPHREINAGIPATTTHPTSKFEPEQTPSGQARERESLAPRRSGRQLQPQGGVRQA